MVSDLDYIPFPDIGAPYRHVWDAVKQERFKEPQVEYHGFHVSIVEFAQRLGSTRTGLHTKCNGPVSIVALLWKWKTASQTVPGTLQASRPILRALVELVRITDYEIWCSSEGGAVKR